jgi:hypothetical protein
MNELSKIKKENSMWFVWCSGSRGMIPKFNHATKEEAMKEAERLARMNPGVDFHVLKSIGYCNKKDVEWTMELSF